MAAVTQLVRIARSAAVGGQQVTERLAQALGCSPAEAERAKLAGRTPDAVKGGDDAALTPREQTALDLLSDRPAHVDEISRTMGLEAHSALGLLLVLEAKGLARSMPGKFYIRETRI